MFFLNKCRNWLNERPLILIVVVTILVFIFYILNIFACYLFYVLFIYFEHFSGLCYILHGSINNVSGFKILSLTDFLKEYKAFCSILTAVVVAWLFGYLGIYRFKNFFKTLKMACFDLIIISILFILKICDVMSSNLEFVDFFHLILGSLYMFSIGFFEDTVTLGLQLNCLVNKWGTTRKNVLVCILISASVFGLYHLINISEGAHLVPCLIQVIFAFSYSVFRGVFYIQGGCLWVPIILHAFHDFVGMFELYFTKNGLNELAKGQGAASLINEYGFGLLLWCIIYIFLAWAAFNKNRMDEVVSRVKLKLQNSSK